MSHRISAVCKWIMLLVGLCFLATGIAISIWANIGVAPWTTLTLGIRGFTSLTIGRISQIVSLVLVLMGTLLTRRYIGIATVVSVVFVGEWIDVLSNIMPPMPSLWILQLIGIILGTAVMGIGTGLYLSADLGAGPRDTIMLGLVDRFGLRIAYTRTAIEVVVLALGWLMGGPIGIGTVIQAFGIGFVIQKALSTFQPLRQLIQQSKPKPEEIPFIP